MRITALNVATDARAILELQREGYAVEAALIGFPDLPPLLEPIESLERSTETFVGAFVDDTLSGVISWTYDGDLLDICRLVVSPLYARRGIGRALLRRAIAEGRRTVVQTAAANAPAIALYLAEGFVLTKTWPAEGIPTLLLARFVRGREPRP